MNSQERILSFIGNHIQQKGYPPTIREIGAAVGLKSTSTVHGHLDRLEQKGLIRRGSDSPRAIEIIHPIQENDAERQRIAVRVLEREVDGTFKRLIIGGKNYVLERE